MNTEIKIFNNPQFGEIRTATTESGEPLFCLSDVCKALRLTNPSSVARRLDDDELVKCDLGRDNQIVGNSIANYITESGFYNVILFSNSINVKPFRKWVTSEVLPSIRKHGVSITDLSLENIIKDPSILIGLLTEMKNEKDLKAAAVAEKEHYRVISENQITVI